MLSLRRGGTRMLRFLPFVIVLFLACAPASPGTPTPNLRATVEAQVQEILSTAVPTATPRVVRVAFPTFTPTPRPTPSVTPTPTPEPRPTPLISTARTILFGICEILMTTKRSSG